MITRKDTNIDLLMAERGIKRDKELAELLGISVSLLSKNLSKSVTFKTLGPICKVLNVTLKEILK
jgi:DNA-binding Xre family transcriptional regulator